MLQTAPTNATVVGNSATGPEHAELACHTRVATGAASIIRVDPSILEPHREAFVTEQPSRENDLLENFVEVTESHDYYELEDLSPKHPHVKGNLKRNIEFWREIGASQYILSVIEDGYSLVFDSIPSQACFKNNNSALKHSEFVEKAILELLESDRIIECSEVPFVVNPLSVSTQSCGKKRLILDLRHVNKCLTKQRVKYEDYKTALNYFHTGAFMASFDLKSGYHHIDIHTEYQCFLGFAWKFDNSINYRYFMFCVLPFGLSSAPYIFTKTLKPLEKYWRLQGVNIALFLDDGMILDYDKNVCERVCQRIQSDLNNAGFIVNNEKCIWEPCQLLEWLGLVWNSSIGTIAITERRVQSIKEGIQNFYNNGMSTCARELASFVGKIISAGAVYGNLSRIMTRYCSINVAAAQDWDSKFQLDVFCQRELKFWEVNAEGKNYRNVSHEECYKSNFIIYSDASSTGCEAHFDLNGEQICHQLWDDKERMRSSTWRELSTIEFALRSFLPLIEGSYLKWFSDSQTACRIVEVGSMKTDLHVIASRIFQFCANHCIQLDIQWLPRTELERADYISRIIDVDDWQLSTYCFNEIERVWGPHTIDCFANSYNKKVSRFFSRFWNPECSGVDFFVQKLTNENCLVVPPIGLIGRALNYLYAHRTIATVVVPFWPSSYFWPILCRKFHHCIKEHKLFYGNHALTHGKNTNSLLGSSNFYGKVLALRMDFVQ